MYGWMEGWMDVCVHVCMCEYVPMSMCASNWGVGVHVYVSVWVGWRVCNL